MTFFGVKCAMEEFADKDVIHFYDCDSACKYVNGTGNIHEQSAQYWNARGATPCTWHWRWWGMTHAVIEVSPTSSGYCGSQHLSFNIDSITPTIQIEGYSRETGIMCQSKK